MTHPQMVAITEVVCFNAAVEEMCFVSVKRQLFLQLQGNNLAETIAPIMCISHSIQTFLCSEKHEDTIPNRKDGPALLQKANRHSESSLEMKVDLYAIWTAWAPAG